MRLIATADFHYGPAGTHDAETPVIHRGDEFTVHGTGTANAAEVAQRLTSTGLAVTPEDWPKAQARTQPGYDWARAEVERMNRVPRS